MDGRANFRSTCSHEAETVDCRNCRPEAVSALRGQRLLTGQCLAASLMVLSQSRIGCRDGFKLTRDATQLLTRDSDVELIVAELGINAVADAAGTGDHSTCDGRRKSHAGRTAEQRKS